MAMMNFFLLCLLTLLSLCLPFAYSSLSFNEWCFENNKEYRSLEEKNERETVYMNNLKLIDDLNVMHKEREITFKINQFGDMTSDEFKSMILMTPQAPVNRPQVSIQSFTTVLNPPDTFDWREKGVVTSVKDQGTVGSCWAFSTVQNIEGQWALTGNTLTSLSAEQLVDCDDTYDPKNLHMDCGVFGGWPYLAYEYIMKTGGVERESSYPYCSGMGKCFPCVPRGWNNTRCGPPPTYCNDTFSCSNKLNKSEFVSGLKVKSWIAIEKDESTMLSSLLKQGPLSVLINAELLQFYHSGVWDPIVKCDPKSLDHAVLLVGYGTDKGIFSKKPYWLVKNSWGHKWGEDGYFKLIRGKGKCGIDQEVTSAILE